MSYEITAKCASELTAAVNQQKQELRRKLDVKHKEKE